MNVEIRQATPDDAALLHALAAATFALACPPSTTRAAIDEFIAEQLSEARFAVYLADRRLAILIAFDGGDPAGYSLLAAGEPEDPDVAAVVAVRPAVELGKFYVMAHQHGRGIASELMAASLVRAEAMGASSLWLGVNEENARARRFYEKSGFTPVGTKKFLVGGRQENDLVFALTVER